MFFQRTPKYSCSWGLKWDPAREEKNNDFVAFVLKCRGRRKITSFIFFGKVWLEIPRKKENNKYKLSTYLEKQAGTKKEKNRDQLSTFLEFKNSEGGVKQQLWGTFSHSRGVADAFWGTSFHQIP